MALGIEGRIKPAPVVLLSSSERAEDTIIANLYASATKAGAHRPRHGPIPTGETLRLLQEVPDDGAMGPGFRQESGGRIC